jgi:thiol:disulfide interchange protein
MYIVIIVLAALGLIALTLRGCPPLPPGADHLPWLSSMSSGLQAAQASKLPVVVDVGAKWCHWCTKLETESFPDRSVQALAGKFVWVRLDADVDQATLGQYQISMLPTILVLDASGREVSRLTAFATGPELAAFLKSALTRTTA